MESESSPQKTVKAVPDSEEISKMDLNSTVESIKDLNSTMESTKDVNVTAESAIDLNSTIDSVDLNTTDTTNKLLNTTVELDTNSKKVLSPAQRKKHEEKMKQKQEREEQRIKERKEKEEQRRKEKEDRELQKRKDREEKDEQKRKEREEKEEQKRKEREEKEELKRKEKEEKEEQKRKEREEKEELKRKEKEEKEQKRQQEIDEKNREKKKKEELMLKEKAAFVNFFVPRKSSGPVELKKPEEEKKNAFMPFEVKSDMRVAPVIRFSISSTQKDALTDKLQQQNESVLYLEEIRNGKKLGRFPRTWPVEDDDDSVILLEETDIGERLEEEKPKVEKMRAKLLKFHENRRPAYFGTWRKKSRAIKSRKPLVKDTKFFDYEVDSDDDWEEEEPGEDIGGSEDEEKETEADDYEVDNDFFVPHGYLSDEEGQDEGGEGDGEEPQCEMETKLKLLQEEFEKEMSSKTERIKPRLIGCIWENRLLPKMQDAIHQFLEDRMMIVCGPIKLQKRDLLLGTNAKLSTSKNSASGRKQLSEENIPDFLSLVHGNTNNQNMIVNEFINYLAKKESDKPVSKASLFANLKRYAKWKKCPDEGVMHKKYCWYVNEEIRNQFNLQLELPNNWAYIGTNADESNTTKRKLIV